MMKKYFRQSISILAKTKMYMEITVKRDGKAISDLFIYYNKLDDKHKGTFVIISDDMDELTITETLYDLQNEITTDNENHTDANIISDLANKIVLKLEDDKHLPSERKSFITFYKEGTQITEVSLYGKKHEHDFPVQLSITTKKKDDYNKAIMKTMIDWL